MGAGAAGSGGMGVDARVGGVGGRMAAGEESDAGVRGGGGRGGGGGGGEMAGCRKGADWDGWRGGSCRDGAGHAE
eukprot:2121504-Prymnesium_polylepis.1